MVDNKQGRFKGFTPKTLAFLKDLRANNKKEWFEAHKKDYQIHLLEPLQDLVIDLGDFMLTIDPYLEIAPKINRTISRIYRDVRFSKDKSPFRSAMWITFKRPGKDWANAPAYFLEISPDAYRFGMGFYSASKETMDRLREMIEHKPNEFKDAISFYPNQPFFALAGEKYKNILDRDIPEEFQDWYQRKNLYLVCNREIDEHFYSKDLVGDLMSGFDLVAPFYHYLQLASSHPGNKIESKSLPRKFRTLWT